MLLPAVESNALLQMGQGSSGITLHKQGCPHNPSCLDEEGGITRDGEVQLFRPGIENIIERRGVPVIPIALTGLWGSWFSRQSGGGLRKIPGRLWARIESRARSSSARRLWVGTMAETVAVTWRQF